MLNFIYGALTMWFALGAVILLEDTFGFQPIGWDRWFSILITFPALIIAIPAVLIGKLYSNIKFNWEHEWRWKWEKIKEKIKYRY